MASAQTLRSDDSAFYLLNDDADLPVVSTLNGEMLALEAKCGTTLCWRGEEGVVREHGKVAPDISARMETVNDEIIRLEDEMAQRFSKAAPSDDRELLRAHPDLVAIHLDLLKEISSITRALDQQLAPLRLVKAHDSN